MCGSVCVRRMDETLRVRLCVPCRNSSAVPLNDLPSEVITLVHFSTKLVPSKRRWGINPHALRDDVDMVTAKLKELEESKLELEEWKEERLTELKDRREQSIVLAGYLDSVESCRDDELSQRRVEFRLEVERRLLELDWKPKDFEFPWNRRRDWTTLVDQPKVLTDRIWTNLKPKLIPVLERNRAARLEREMAERKASRRARLSQLLNDIKLDAVPNVHATMIRPTDTSSTRSSPSVDEPTAEILHKGIFPDFVDALEWPIFKSLYETDVPIAEVMTRFDEQRDEIGMLISDWIERVEEHMAELLRKGRVSDGLPEEAPEPTLSVEESALKPFRYLSDDQKLLYRADSFFEPTKNSKSPSVACFFDAVVSSGYLITYGSTLPMRPVKKPFDVTSVKRNADAQATARTLLASLGKPNASFLEMRCPGQGFACGRCHDGSVKTWEDMVHHYVTQKRQWNDIQPSLSESGITYHNLHDPEMDTTRPLVQLVMPQDVLADMTGSEPRRVCKVCIKISGLPVVRGAESKIITHVKEVHGIESPEFLNHYGNYFDLPGLLSAMFNDDVYGPYDSEGDGYGFLGPGYDSEEEHYGMW
ncbi:hypothetical protein BDV93DRAFT_261418 [Ceratobasidium sp. AG-I]|nr:hypothetical protein BDV93DRAFT_261418 [Ceratobasidium sp. AG-I]